MTIGNCVIPVEQFEIGRIAPRWPGVRAAPAIEEPKPSARDAQWQGVLGVVEGQFSRQDGGLHAGILSGDSPLFSPIPL